MAVSPQKNKAAKEHIITGKAVATKIQILDGTFLMQQASMQGMVMILLFSLDMNIYIYIWSPPPKIYLSHFLMVFTV